MCKYNGFADEIIEKEIVEHYPHDKLLTPNNIESGIEKVKFRDLSKYHGNGLPIFSEIIDGELVYGLRHYGHTLIHGMSGSGKTTVFYENFLRAVAAYPDDIKSSMIYIDYKHDVMKKHKIYLQQMGYRIKVLDLLDILQSDCWNIFYDAVLAYVSLSDAKDTQNKERIFFYVDSAINGIANAICPTPSEVRDPMWADGARAYIRALIFSLFDLAKEKIILPEDVTLENLARLHKYVRVEWSIRREQLGSSTLSVKELSEFAPFKALGKTFTEADYVSDLLTVLGCGNITGSSFMGTIESSLSTFCDFAVSSVTKTSNNDINFKTMIEEPTFICIVPSGTAGSNSLISMFFGRIFDFVREQTIYEPLKRSLHILLDELCNMHRISQLCTYISTTRALGVYWHLGVQSDSQLISKYGEDGSINLINNCTEFFFGSQELSTLKRFASQGGSTTSVNINSRLGIINHLDFTTFNLINTTDLAELTLGKFFVRQARCSMLKTEMIPVFAVEEFGGDKNLTPNQANKAKQIKSHRINFRSLATTTAKGVQDEDKEDVIARRRRELLERLRKISDDD